MDFQPVEDTVRAAILYTASGTNLVNTVWIRKLGGLDMTDGEAIAFELDEWASVNLVPNLCTNTSYQSVTVYDMQSPDSWVVVNTTSGPQAGSDAAAPASLASAMTVTFQTARRGRSYRGRNYISGWAEDVVGAKTFASDIPGDIEDAYDALATKMGAIGCQHVVTSFVQDGVRLPAAVTTPVVSYRANLRIYKQGNRTK